jgi:hypothetical protein
MITIDIATVVADDAIGSTLATSTGIRKCTLCGGAINPGVPRMVWSWRGDEIDPVERVLHCHRGCDEIRRELDVDEWTEGDGWDACWEAVQSTCSQVPLEIGSTLTPEGQADRGAELVAYLLDRHREWCEDSP